MKYAVTFTNDDGQYLLMMSGSKRMARVWYFRYKHIAGVDLKYIKCDR